MLEKTRLTNICLYSQNLEHVKPQDLAQSLNNLEDLALYYCQLTKQQVAEIFTVMNKETRIKKLLLYIGENSYTSVDCRAFAQGVNKLQEFAISGNPSLWDYNMMHDLMKAMFAQCAVQTNLKTLVLPSLDLSFVDPVVLAKCLNKMQNVYLCGTKLTKQQLVEVFINMDQETNLKQLNLLHNDLSDVNPDTLARCIANLETVNISMKKMTKEQGEKLLQLCSVKRNNIMLWKGGYFGQKYQPNSV
eukprot:GFUD01037691.1.p1 GENE.GFUD01037691.1~~GFUD01037691.1.p1  ORF type:complete len:275 (-),score=48.55 GFUD01037691.1:265-1002(-)